MRCSVAVLQFQNPYYKVKNILYIYKYRSFSWVEKSLSRTATLQHCNTFTHNPLVINRKDSLCMVITLQPTIPFCPQADIIRAKSPQNLHRFALYLGSKKTLFSPTFAPKLTKTALKHGEKHQNLSL